MSLKVCPKKTHFSNCLYVMTGLLMLDFLKYYHEKIWCREGTIFIYAFQNLVEDEKIMKPTYFNCLPTISMGKRWWTQYFGDIMAVVLLLTCYHQSYCDSMKTYVSWQGGTSEKSQQIVQSGSLFFCWWKVKIQLIISMGLLLLCRSKCNWREQWSMDVIPLINGIFSFNLQ